MLEVNVKHIKYSINGARDEIKDARNKMITDHRHVSDSNGGWSVICVDDYNSLIEEYESKINHIEEIIKSKIKIGD